MNDNLKEIVKLMAMSVTAIGDPILVNLRMVAKDMDSHFKAENLGNNVMINIACHILQMSLADFAAHAGKDHKESYKEFGEALGPFVNEWIAKFSVGGKSIMLQVPKNGCDKDGCDCG